MCIGESRIRDVWRRQNWNEMQMLCRSCDLNALLIRLGWQPWRPLGGTCTSACPTENRVGARPEPASASELKYAVSWRQARGKSSQTKPSQVEASWGKSRQPVAKRRQVESASQNHYWPQMPQHTKKAMRRRKKELKANPKPTTSHTHTHTQTAHTHSNKCHAYCATDPISRLVFFYTERTARRSSSGIGCGFGCDCGSHNGFEMLTGSAQPAATAAVWEIQRYFARTDPAACSFTAAPDTVRQRATNTHTRRWRWSRRDRVRAWVSSLEYVV